MCDSFVLLLLLLFSFFFRLRFKLKIGVNSTLFCFLHLPLHFLKIIENFGQSIIKNSKLYYYLCINLDSISFLIKRCGTKPKWSVWINWNSLLDFRWQLIYILKNWFWTYENEKKRETLFFTKIFECYNLCSICIYTLLKFELLVIKQSFF